MKNFLKNFLKMFAVVLTMLIVAVAAIGIRVVAFAPDVVARVGHAVSGTVAQPATAAAAPKGGRT